MAQINKPSDYFNTKLYTGNGSTQSITGVGFEPDWVWIKNRVNTTDHLLFDVVRNAPNFIKSNSNSAEVTGLTSVLNSFDTDGFTVGNDGGINSNNDTYASWNWLADNTSGSSNTDGTITSTVSANTTSGFSVVSYTGTGSNATVGHGLGVAPKMIITKVRSASGNNWSTYHSSLGAGNVIWLNLTNSSSSDSTFWNNTTPTSSVFSIGTQGDTNRSSETIIAYCFAEKKGYSKFGSYTGNGNADGTFVYTGFSPSFVMFKNATTGSTNWHIVDNKRDTFNIVDKLLLPNESGSEITQSALDLTSNGFKIRVTNGFVNTSGDNYIYMAFAENPLVGTNNIPATAR